MKRIVATTESTFQMLDSGRANVVRFKTTVAERHAVTHQINARVKRPIRGWRGLVRHRVTVNCDYGNGWQRTNAIY